MEKGVVVEAELLPDPLAVFQDLGRMRILLTRHVARLLEQRHVDEARGVALRAGVAVPVPRTAEVAAPVDNAHALDAGLLQPGTGDQPREAAPDERHRDVVGLRLARDHGHVRIVGIVGELILQFHVLVVAIRPQALGPLLRVLQLEGVLVDRRHRERVKAQRDRLVKTRRYVRQKRASGMWRW